MNFKKISIHSLAMKIILLFPITTLALGAMNKFLFAISAILMAFSLFKVKFRSFDIIILIATAMVYAWSLFVTAYTAVNINEYFYYIFFVIYIFFIVKDKKSFEEFCRRETMYMAGVCLIWNVLIAVSLLLPSSYETGAFISFSGDTFRMSMSASFILAIVIVLVRKSKYYFAFAILPMYAIMEGGSRTYFAIAIPLFLISLYYVCGNVKNFIITCVPVGAVFAVLLIGSGIMSKFDSALNIGVNDYYKDPLVKFTSGRSLFWTIDMIAFNNSKFINKILGSGFNFVYEVNLQNFGNDIWAHNDFIGILLNFGLLGLAIYLIMYTKLILAFGKSLKKSKILLVIVIFVWLFNAFFNMFYTYFSAVAAYPFIVYGTACIADDKKGYRNNTSSTPYTQLQPSRNKEY